MSESESGQQTNSSREAEQINERIEAVGGGIAEHLQHAELGSTRMNAFTDYTDLQDAIARTPLEGNNSREVAIEETIRQRSNGLKGYEKEYVLAEYMTSSLKAAVMRKLVFEGKSFKDSSNDKLLNSAFAQELQKIKKQEIDKRNK